MADNNLEILIVQAMLDKKISTENIKKDLLEISKMIGSLKLSVNIDNTELTKLANSVELITKGISNKKIEIFDKSQLQEGQKLYATLQDVKNEFSKLGQVKVTNESLNPITKELQGFSIAVTNADNKVEKLKFDLLNISDGGKINQMFSATKLNQVDNIESKLKAEDVLANKIADGRIIAQEKFAKLQEATQLKRINGLHEEALVENNARNEMEQAFKTTFANREKLAAELNANQAASIYKNAELERAENTRTQAQIEKNIKNAIASKENALIKLRDLERRYGNSLDSKQFASTQQAINQINPVSADAPDKIRQVNTQLKELSANAATARSNMMGFSEQFGEALKKFPVWIAVSSLVMGAIHLVRDGLQGMIDIESKMAGYVQTNEAYFTTQEKINTSTSQFIQTTHALGAEINNVLESARLYGRMYKDVGVVQELVRQSTKLSTVDLVSLADATKGMEAILAQYHAQLKSVNDAQVIGNQLLDSFSKVAHDSAIPARDLLVAYERMGSVAHDTGVSVDFMNGLLASGFRNTALSGENLGNMWKTVLGNLHSDKAVAELERLNVKTKEVVDGVEQWRKAEDIILDLSVKVIGQNGDLTKSYEDIARGVYQYQKLAASIDLGSIIQGQAASINSLGSTSEYLHTQLDTIAKKSNQVKASFLDLFNTAGNDGLRSAIKGILDVTDQLLMGTSQISTGTFELIGTLGTLAVAYLTLKNPIVSVVSAVQTLIASRTANTVATVTENAALTANIGATEKVIVSSTGATLAKIGETVAVETTTVAITAEATAAAAATVTTALWTAGISIAIGALAIWIMSLGSEKKAQEDASAARERSISLQEQEYTQIGKQIDVIPKWVTIHNDLVKALDSGKLSAEGQTKAKNDLDKVSKALADTIGQEGYAQLKAADFTDIATQRIITSLTERKKALKQDMLNTLNQDASSLDDSEFAALQKRNTANRELDKINSSEVMPGAVSALDRKNKIADLKKQQEDANKELDDINRKKQANADKSLTVESDLFALNALSGSDGKSLSSTQTADEAKTVLKEKMDAFNHLVTIQSDGYTSAADKIAKLKAIKSQVQGSLSDVDMYSLDEDIYKLEHPNETKGVSTDIKMGASETKRDMNEFARSNRELDNQITLSQDNMSNLTDTSAKYREELKSQIPVYEKKQQLAHEEADSLRDTNARLKEKLATEKLSASSQNAVLNQIDANETSISKLGHSWFEYGKSASEANAKITDSLVKQQAETYNNLQTDLTNEISAAENANQSKLEISNFSYEYLKKKIGDLSQYTLDDQKKLNKQLADLRKTRDDEIVKSEEDLVKKYEESLKKTDEFTLKQHQKTSQDKVDGLQSQIDNLNRSNQLTDDTAEKAKRQAEISTLNTTLYLYQNDTLANISDEMAKQLDLVQAKADAIQRQNDLLKAQQDLETAKNEKNVRLFKDGAFQWVADPRKVAASQDSLDKLNESNSKDKLTKVDELNKQIKTKQEDLNKFLLDLDRKHQTESLQDQIKAEQKAMKEEEEAFNTKWADIDLTAKTELDKLRITYGDKWKLIIDDLTKKADEAEAQYRRIAGAQATASTSNSSSGSFNPPSTASGSSDFSTSAGGFNSQTSATGSGSQASSQSQILAEMNANSSAWQSASATEKNALSAKNDQLRQDLSYVGGQAVAVDGKWKLQSLDTGGFTGDNEGIAMLHKKELVLNSSDTPKILEAIKLVRVLPDISSMVKAFDFSSIIGKFKNNSSSNDNSVSIQNLTVKSNDAKSFARNLRQLVDNQ